MMDTVEDHERSKAALFKISAQEENTSKICATRQTSPSLKK